MQQLETSKSSYEEIKQNYNESLRIVQELKEQNKEDKNERQQ